jgi:hypothetical protein
MWIFATAVFLVLVFFLYRHTKTTLKVLSVVAVLIGGAIWYLFFNDSSSTSRVTYVDRDAQVSVSLNYSVTECNADHPLRVTIINRADKTVEKIKWYVAAFVPGRSSDITKNYGEYSSDYILEPNKMISLCYKAPQLSEPREPSDLRWEAQLPTVSWRY